MTCCRSDRFFAYSVTSDVDPNFPDYKKKLEDVVHWYDIYDNALSCTPHVTAFSMTLVAGLHLGLPNFSYSTIFSILQMGIPALSTLIIVGSKVAKNHAAGTAKDLISTGIKMRFFEFDPPDISINDGDTNPLLSDTKQEEIHRDAIRHRLLGS